MSSFQFPANPSDGDIVVRGNLQAFYDAETNTWRVSEIPTAPGIPGPPGPSGQQGEKGDPGKGVEISGIVDTEADLPATNTVVNQFWLVDDTNTLYFSNGLEWFNFGSPIQGPQGTPGADGADGTDGLNGAPGKGWYGTLITDDANGYRIEFLSNDNLSFITDDLRGPAGDLEVASETNLGGIKIGKGLSIEPDGTANANQAYVEIDDIELGNNVLQYIPRYYTLGEVKSEEFPPGYSNPDYVTNNRDVVITMPGLASSATVYVFAGTSMKGGSSYTQAEGTEAAFRCYAANVLELTNATYTDGNTTVMGFGHTHNLSYPWSSATNANRRSTIQTTKINTITFTPGATVAFKFTQAIEQSSQVDFEGGLMRLVVVPYRGTQPLPVTTVETKPGVFTDNVGTVYTNNFTTAIEELNVEVVDETPAVLRKNIEDVTTTINNELEYATPAVSTQLLSLRDEIRNLRNYLGTEEEVVAEARRLLAEVEAITSYTFVFE
jgi:hypothetical protein